MLAVSMLPIRSQAACSVPLAFNKRTFRVKFDMKQGTCMLTWQIPSARDQAKKMKNKKREYRDL